MFVERPAIQWAAACWPVRTAEITLGILVPMTCHQWLQVHARETSMNESLLPKIRTLLDELYGQNHSKPHSFFFEAIYEVLPELEELDPERVRQMVVVAFAQNEVDHASHAEEALRHLLARVRHEANRSPEREARVTGTCADSAAPCAGQINGLTRL
jgi:hypothetical protein